MGVRSQGFPFSGFFPFSSFFRFLLFHESPKQTGELGSKRGRLLLPPSSPEIRGLKFHVRRVFELSSAALWSGSRAPVRIARFFRIPVFPDSPIQRVEIGGRISGLRVLWVCPITFLHLRFCPAFPTIVSDQFVRPLFAASVCGQVLRLALSGSIFGQWLGAVFAASVFGHPLRGRFSVSVFGHCLRLVFAERFRA